MLRFAAMLFGLCLAPVSLAADDSRLDMLLSGEEARDWTAVGRLQIEGKGFCTAALISEREVLTAAHCVFDRDGSPVSADRMQFAAGYRDGRPVTARAVRRAAPHPGFDPLRADAAQSVGTDVALIELQTPINAAQMAPFRLGTAPDRGEDVGVVSYAVEREEAPSLQEICGVLETYGPAMILSCDVDFGSSGAPIFALGPEGPRIVGVVTAKAMVGERQVALSASAEAAIFVLRSSLAAQTAGHFNDAGQVRVISPGERNGDIGAKFVRP